MRGVKIDYKGVVLVLMVGIILWFTWNGYRNGEGQPEVGSNHLATSLDSP